jgi:predicted small secreted protein
MRKVFVLFAAAAALTTAACNTVAGVGRDTQAAGSAVEEAAEDAAD